MFVKLARSTKKYPENFLHGFDAKKARAPFEALAFFPYEFKCLGFFADCIHHEEDDSNNGEDVSDIHSERAHTSGSKSDGDECDNEEGNSCS